MGIWSSLVYGPRLENEYFIKSRRFKSDSARNFLINLFTSTYSFITFILTIYLGLLINKIK